jgi:hypothetical protein
LIQVIQGAGKTKSVASVVGAWVRGQKSTRVMILFPNAFLIVFLNSPHRKMRNAQNRDKSTREKPVLDCFAKIF